MKAHRTDRGVTLVELMMAMAIAGIFISAMVKAYTSLIGSTMISRQRTVATNLAQERLEALKDYSYYRLVVTPDAAVLDQSDSSNPYTPETIPSQGVTFTRYTMVQKVMESGSSLTLIDSLGNDEGLKMITVAVTWVESNATRGVTLRSALEDPNRTPLNSAIRGAVTNPSTSPVADVLVYVTANPNWSATTDSLGQYTIRVANGAYRVTATHDAYTSQTSGDLTLSSTTLVHNFTSYTLKQTGMVSGYVFVRPNLLISKICGRLTGDSDNEFLEIYNPTSVTLTMMSSTIRLTEVDGNNNLSYIAASFPTQTIQPHGYYLIGSSSQIVVLGVTYAADAYWASGSRIHTTKGGIILADAYGNHLDKVGWAPSGQSAPDNAVEEMGFDLTPDPDLTDRCLERRPYPATSPLGSANGSAYDSQNNNRDFYKHAGLVAPYTSAYTETPTGGTIIPQTAIIFVDDGLSSTTVPTTLGAYTDTNIASGTWNLTASGGLSMTGLTYSVLQTGFVMTNNASLTRDLVLTGGTTYGYIVGQVTTNGTTALTGILVNAGGNETRTGAYGSYYFALAEGTYDIVANYDYDNANYSQESYSPSITLTTGVVWEDININLNGAGKISGKVTVNGTDALPNIRVSARDVLGVEQGSAMTDASGNYTISGLPTTGNNYTVQPLLDPRETASPSSTLVTVVSGATQGSKNFTVSNALGTISGTVKTSNGSSIITGVMIVASTATIAGDPPTINSSVRSGGTTYYSDTSNSEGTYSLSVRGAVSPGTSYKVYAWYTNSAGVTTKKSGTATVIAGGSATVNFDDF